MKQLYKIGGITALLIVALIPVQLFVFILWPPPLNVQGFFNLFQGNPMLGLLSLDLLYILSNTLLIFVYLALYASLKQSHPASMLIALVLGLMGIASYYASTIAFEMFSLSRQFSLAESEEVKLQLLTAGKILMETYKGTAFDIYYVLNAITLLIISLVMFKTSTFSKTTAISGLISGILMLIPTTAGSIGLILGILSLLPWTVFSILIAKRLFKLNKSSAV